MKIFTLPINIFFMLIFFINEGFCLAPKSLLEEHIYEEIPYDDHKNETKGKKKLSREDDSESEIFQEVTHFDLNRVQKKEKIPRDYISFELVADPLDPFRYESDPLSKSDYKGSRFVYSEVMRAFRKAKVPKQSEKKDKKYKGVRQDSEETKDVRQHRKLLPNYYSNERIENFDNGDLSLEENEDFRYAASYVYQPNPPLPKRNLSLNTKPGDDSSQKRQQGSASQEDRSIQQGASNIDLDGYLVPVGRRANPFKILAENQRAALQSGKKDKGVREHIKRLPISSSKRTEDFDIGDLSLEERDHFHPASYDRSKPILPKKNSTLNTKPGVNSSQERQKDEEFKKCSDSFFDMGQVWNYIMVNLFEERENLETYSYIKSESFAITLFHTIVRTLHKEYLLMEDGDQAKCLIKSLVVMKNMSKTMDEAFIKKGYKKGRDLNNHLKLYFKRILPSDYDNAIVKLMDELVGKDLALKKNSTWFHLTLRREWGEDLEKEIKTSLETISKKKIMKKSFFSDLLSSFNDKHKQRYAA